MKRLNKKGFTLIEMVIVIVIIAILAAILVPSLLTYVDNANEKKMMSAGDTIRNAVNSQIAEMYKDGTDINTTSDDDDVYDADFWKIISEEADATVSGLDDTATYFVEFTVESKKLTKFSVTYNGKVATLKDGSWVVTDAE